MKRNLVILAALAVVLTACSGSVTQETTTTTTETTTTTTTPVATATTSKELPPLLPSDLAIDLTVIEDNCFGSAGALVTVLPELRFTTLRGPVNAGAKRYLVVFEIAGVEGGTETHNLTFEALEYVAEGIMVSTESCDHDLSATVTRVFEQ